MLEGFVPFPDEFVNRYRDKGLWIDKTIAEELDGSIEKNSNRIALACNGQNVTYRELGERATRLALHFIEKGLKPYDRIILQLPNELEFAYVFYAAVKIGIIPIMSLPAHRATATATLGPTAFTTLATASWWKLGQRKRGWTPSLFTRSLHTSTPCSKFINSITTAVSCSLAV